MEGAQKSQIPVAGSLDRNGCNGQFIPVLPHQAAHHRDLHTQQSTEKVNMEPTNLPLQMRQTFYSPGASDADASALRMDNAYKQVQEMSRQLAKVAAPIAHIGDGNCGQVLEYVKEALASAGLYVDPRTRPPIPPKKKVIKQGLRTQVLERDAYRCVFCGSHKDLCVDHIKPESKGGELHLDNLQTLCRSCNSIKGAKE